MKTETIISADRTTRFWQYLRDLWEYRDLFRAFVERDIRVRYKQTVLGVIWVILTPLLFSGIFSIMFARIIKLPDQGLPLPLYFLAAMIPWICFSNGLSQAAGSMESSSALISKVYFPRLLVPAAMIAGTVVDFLIGWLFFNIVAICWTYFPSIFSFSSTNVDPDSVMRVYWTWKFIPFTVILLVLQLSTAMGIGVVLAALNAQYRDIRYLTPVLVQVGFWITPIILPAQRFLETRFKESLSFLLYMNPMAGVIESYRALLSGDYIPYRILAWNFLVATVLLVVGIYFFRKREQRLVDIL